MENENQTNESEQVKENKRSYNNVAFIVIAVVVLVVVAAFFVFTKRGGDNVMMETESTEESVMEPTGMEGESMEPQDGMESGESMEEGVVEVKVNGFEYGYTPETITVNEGDTVRIVFENTGKMIHNFIIDEFDVATKTIPAGETDTVEFVADTVGTYSFYCSVGNHRALGMEGTLTVE
jgi:nitrosocyanin